MISRTGTLRPEALPAAAGRGAPVLPLVAVGGALSILSTNIFLTAAAVAALAAIWSGALASPFRSVLAGYLSYQWTQVTAKVWMANVFGIDLSVPQVAPLYDKYFTTVYSSTPESIVLGLACVSATGLAARMTFRDARVLDLGALTLRPRGLFVGFVVFLLVGRFIGPVAGGFAQPVLILSNMRYAFVILLAYLWISQSKGLGYLIAAVVVEVVLGFTGYFAGFAPVFILLAIGSIPAARGHWKRVRRGALIAAPFLIVMVSAWQVIKPTYRAIVSGGTQTQTVTIDFEERLRAVGELSGALGASDLLGGLVSLGTRLEYVDFLANVLEQVPRAIPHQSGALWGEAVYHVLTPRFLFPDKPPLPSDSDRTMQYTGRQMASGDKGTSISIGYVGDSYIDFGVVGAIVISLAFGVFFAGIGSRVLARIGPDDFPIAVAVLVVTISDAKAFEASSIKMFPGLLWSSIVGITFMRLIWPRLRAITVGARV
jgi:hypothetical protein